MSIKRRFAGALLAGAALALGGCASQSRLVVNDKLSDDVKVRSFRSYQEILLIPPKEDPRELVPRVAAELRSMGFRVRLADPVRPLVASQGTGFVVGAGGLILTCAHVMGEETVASVSLEGRMLPADLVKLDRNADLALLRLREVPEGLGVLSLRDPARGIRLGEEVTAIGFPLSHLLGSGVHMTRGLVSATAGIRDDALRMQISAEVQPGNSGGPVLDKDGLVIGVVQQTVNPQKFFQSTGGSLPQNLNFALKPGPVADFLRGTAVAAGAPSAPAAPGLDSAARGVVRLFAGTGEAAEAVHDRLVVRLQYTSYWDLWYRFQVFLLATFDYESRELLFVAGQQQGDTESTEDIVMRDTFEQFRKAIAAR